MHLLWVFYKKQPVVDKMESKIGAIFAVYWLIVVVGYSLWSLFANAWEYSWIVFPSAAMFCWTIASILQLVGWQVADSDKID